MSAEVPTPNAGKPRSQVVRTNRRQVVLFAALTLILTVTVVAWGGRTWLRNSETLVFAVGDGNSLEAHFAARLAAVLKNNNSRLRIKIATDGDSAKALTAFDRRQADLAVLRTDAKVPPRARALAVLEHDLVLLISPGSKKIKSLAELRKKKIAVLADGDSSSTAFVRNALEISDGSDAGSKAAAGAAECDARQAVRIRRLRRGHRHRARLDAGEGQALRAIRQARRIHRQRDRRGQGAGAAQSRYIGGNAGDGHAVLLARHPR